MQKHRNAIGVNFQGSFLTGYGGLVAPPFQRFYMGGENDLRGFDIRSVSPIAFLPNKAVDEPDQPRRLDRVQGSDEPAAGCLPDSDSVATIVQPGGDLNVFGNVEYRISIVGPGHPRTLHGHGHQPDRSPVTTSHQSRSVKRHQQHAVRMPAPSILRLNCLGGEKLPSPDI